MVNIASEQMLTLQQIAERLPGNNNKPLSYTTVWRWVKNGLGGVQLEAARLGGRWVTNMAAVQRFTERLALQGTSELVAFDSDVDRRLMEKHGL